VVEIYEAEIYEMELREVGLSEEGVDAMEVGWKQCRGACW
jgi:hypothetical protein